MVKRQAALGTRFGYVVADSIYGHDSKFCKKIEDDGHRFLMHVKSNDKVYLADPELKIPKRKFQSRGRPPTRPKSKYSYQKGHRGKK